jgi:hypothetical protein
LRDLAGVVRDRVLDRHILRAFLFEKVFEPRCDHASLLGAMSHARHSGVRQPQPGDGITCLPDRSSRRYFVALDAIRPRFVALRMLRDESFHALVA